MNRPWFLYAGSLSQCVPIVAAVVHRRRPRGARGWILAWLALLLLADGIALYLGRQHLNNRWVSYAFTPLQALAVLWAMSLWQRGTVARLAIRNSIPLVLVVVVGMSFLEDTQSFSRYTEPILSMVALIVAVYTVASRSAATSDPLLRQDWFFIGIGVGLAYGATAALTPLAFAFARSNPELVNRAYFVRMIAHVLAMISISLGMLCPTPPE